MGAISQFEKATTVAKLRAARERKRAANGKCEGRKSHRELRPEMVTLAHKLWRKNPRTGKRLSYRDISRLLADQGYLNAAGNPYGPSAIKSMVEMR